MSELFHSKQVGFLQGHAANLYITDKDEQQFTIVMPRTFHRYRNVEQQLQSKSVTRAIMIEAKQEKFGGKYEAI